MHDSYIGRLFASSPAHSARPKRSPTAQATVVLVGFVFALVAGIVLTSCGLLQAQSNRPQEDVALVAANAPGPHPWTNSAAAASLPAGLPQSGSDSVDVPGDRPGLYGGTSGVAACDRDQLVSQLDSNPQRAKAWADAADVSDVGDFVGELSPVVLTRDTRVTYYGYDGGEAKPDQSVLQAGTAVLIDNKGVPRVRCQDGSPLRE